MDESQRRDLAGSMYRSTGSYELVLSPVLMALMGFLVDRWIGTTPIITVIAAVLGLLGAAVKLYYGYKNEMDDHEAKAPWAKPS